MAQREVLRVAPLPSRRRLLGQMLVQQGVLGAADLRTWLERQAALPPDQPVRRLGSLLVEAGLLPLRQLAELLANLRQVRAVTCRATTVEPGLRALFPLELLERLEAVPLFTAGRVVAVAMADPHRAEQVAELQAFCPKLLEPLQAPQLYVRRLLGSLRSGRVATPLPGITPPPSLISPAASLVSPAGASPATPLPPSLDSPSALLLPPSPEEVDEGPGFHIQVRRPWGGEPAQGATDGASLPPSPPAEPAGQRPAGPLPPAPPLRPRAEAPRRGLPLGALGLTTLLALCAGGGVGFWAGRFHGGGAPRDSTPVAAAFEDSPAVPAPGAEPGGEGTASPDGEQLAAAPTPDTAVAPAAVRPKPEGAPHRPPPGKRPRPARRAAR